MSAALKLPFRSLAVPNYRRYFTGQVVPKRIVPVDVTVTKANAKAMEGQGF